MPRQQREDQSGRAAESQPEGQTTDPAPVAGEEQATAAPAADAPTSPRNPDRCVVYHPAGRRFTLDHGSAVEEEGKVTGLDVPEGTEDVVSALVKLEAFRLAELARRYDLDVIRVEKVGNGPAIAATLREAGFFVIEFGG
jgi:pyruvate/2-oxoglutarate dehydrogenase complex dihydrolipoamide acyltransferase (E2) component